MKKNRVIIFTTAWGSYVSTYRNCTLPSLGYDIKKLRKEGYEVETIENGFTLTQLPKSEDLGKYRAVNPQSAIILTGLRKTIQRCIDKDAYFFLAPPDTIFSKGTLYNCVRMAENKNDCIAVPHLRIAPREGERFYNKELKTGQELVKMCFDYPHKAFTNSFDENEENGTWAGMSIRKISNNLYAMIHNLPTVYLAQFTVNDLHFWENIPDWGNWDRAWLKMLFMENRVKVVGASDLAFCAEITHQNSNVPENRPGNQYNDRYYYNDSHNNSFNKFYCLLRK